MNATEWLTVGAIGLAFIFIITIVIILHYENQAEHEETRKHVEGARQQISSSADETHGKLDDIRKAVTDKWKSITRPGSRW